jgi:hypothetical protein
MSQYRDQRGTWSGPGGLPAAGFLVAAILATSLVGCSAPKVELEREAAQHLQSRVLAVTESAAANDLAGSLKRLDELVVSLDDAAARGEVSSERQQAIRASIEAVRAELTAQQAAAAEAARVAAEQEAAAQAAAAAAQAAAAEAAAAAAAEAAAAPPPVVVAPAPAQQKPAKNGKPKGKDKDD